MINYKSFTLGVEEEYMVIDPATMELKSHEQQIVIEGQKILKDKGHKIYKVYIGNFVTSLDMNGASLTIVDLDDEIKDLLEFPASPVGMKNY